MESSGSSVGAQTAQATDFPPCPLGAGADWLLRPLPAGPRVGQRLPSPDREQAREERGGGPPVLGDLPEGELPAGPADPAEAEAGAEDPGHQRQVRDQGGPLGVPETFALCHTAHTAPGGGRGGEDSSGTPRAKGKSVWKYSSYKNRGRLGCNSYVVAKEDRDQTIIPQTTVLRPPPSKVPSGAQR